jgi:antitoxin (DNA-binding transcriptional repressor) of toxin-antitoxin stability system
MVSNMIVTMDRAKIELNHLVERAMRGEEVVISIADKQMVKLEPVKKTLVPRKPGSMKGKVCYMSDDFNGKDKTINSMFGVSLPPEVVCR